LNGKQLKVRRAHGARPQLTFTWELSVNFDHRIKRQNANNKLIS